MIKDNIAKIRRDLVAECNGALADMDKSKKRVDEAFKSYEKLLNAAKAEIGTAKSEYVKAKQRYERKRDKLAKTLPGWDDGSLKAMDETEAKLRDEEAKLKAGAA